MEPGKTRRVVVIDPDLVFGQRVRDALAPFGVDVAHEDDLESGVQRALELRADAVVASVDLPDRRGFTVVGRIKAASRGTRVVLFTKTLPRTDMELHAKLKGHADVYLDKREIPHDGLRSALATAIGIPWSGQDEAPSSTPPPPSSAPRPPSREDLRPPFAARAPVLLDAEGVATRLAPPSAAVTQRPSPAATPEVSAPPPSSAPAVEMAQLRSALEQARRDATRSPFSADFRRLQDRVDEAEDELAGLRRALEARDAELARLGDAYAHAVAELRGRIAAAAAERRAAGHVADEVHALRAALEASQAHERELREELAHRARAAEAMAEELADVLRREERRRRELQEDVEQASREQGALRERLADNARVRAELEERLAQREHRVTELLEQLEAREQELRASQRDAERARGRETRELLGLRERLAVAERERDDAVAERVGLTAELAAAREARAGLEEKLRALGRALGAPRASAAPAAPAAAGRDEGGSARELRLERALDLERERRAALERELGRLEERIAGAQRAMARVRAQVERAGEVVRRDGVAFAPALGRELARSALAYFAEEGRRTRLGQWLARLPLSPSDFPAPSPVPWLGEGERETTVPPPLSEGVARLDVAAATVDALLDELGPPRDE